MRNIVQIVFIFLSSVVYIVPMANALDKTSAENLMNEMYAAIATRDPNQITRFFNYYADKDARFIYNVTATEDHNTKANSFNDSRDEFVNYWIGIVKSISELRYKVSIESFEFLKDKNSAIAAVRIDETTLSYIPKPKEYWINTKVLTKVSTNCNVSLYRAVSTPMISGMNCIQRVVVG